MRTGTAIAIYEGTGVDFLLLVERKRMRDLCNAAHTHAANRATAPASTHVHPCSRAISGGVPLPLCHDLYLECETVSGTAPRVCCSDADAARRANS